MTILSKLLLRAMGGGTPSNLWNDLLVWDDAQVWSD